MGTGMRMVDRKWEGNGNSSLKKFPLDALIIFLALYFSSLSAGSLNNLHPLFRGRVGSFDLLFEF